MLTMCNSHDEQKVMGQMDSPKVAESIGLCCSTLDQKARVMMIEASKITFHSCLQISIQRQPAVLVFISCPAHDGLLEQTIAGQEALNRGHAHDNANCAYQLLHLQLCVAYHIEPNGNFSIKMVVCAAHQTVYPTAVLQLKTHRDCNLLFCLLWVTCFHSISLARMPVGGYCAMEIIQPLLDMVH